MKTYRDIYQAVMGGKTVVTTSHYGNTRTYFLGDDGKPRAKFNECQDHLFTLNTNLSIDPLLRVEVI